MVGNRKGANMSVNTKTYQTGKNHSQVVVDNIDEFPRVLVHTKVSVKIRHEISERLVVVENEGPGIVKISPKAWKARVLPPGEGLIEDAREEIDISIVGEGFAILTLEAMSGGT
jgi:hypothetical protein